MLKNRMDADDVTQEVLIKIWTNIEKFNMISARTWIIKTTHNLCIDYLRKRMKASERNYSIDEEFVENRINPDKNSDPQKIIHEKFMVNKVKEKVKALPENLRSIFVLYELQGMKYKEISKALDIPINTVKVYLMRARKKLQVELQHYELQEVI
jgi:RNA polymerase sigma-70 factor (ECF subfamily)